MTSGARPINQLDVTAEKQTKRTYKESVAKMGTTPYRTFGEQAAIFTNGNRFDIPTEFRKFNIKEHYDDWRYFACSVFGKRGSGKSEMMKDLLYQIKGWYDKCYLFSETATLQKIYEYVPEHNRRQSLDVEFLEKVMARQIADVEHKLKNGHEDEIEKILFIFDDVISDDKIRHCQAFNRLYTGGRHLRCAVISLAQEIGGRNGFPKVVRDNSDLVICFFPHNQTDRETVVERYLSIKNKKVGEELLKRITQEEYMAAVMMFRKAPRDYEDYLFWYKVDNPKKIPDFTIGKKNLDFDTYAQVKAKKVNSGLAKVNIPFRIMTDPDGVRLRDL